MTKTQIQVPDELLTRVRQLAKTKEWSLAETFRRGAELLLETTPATPPAEWKAPSAKGRGWKGLSASQLKDIAAEDQERGLPSP